MSKEINGLKTKKMLACGSKLFCVQVDSKRRLCCLSKITTVLPNKIFIS